MIYQFFKNSDKRDNFEIGLYLMGRWRYRAGFFRWGWLNVCLNEKEISQETMKLFIMETMVGPSVGHTFFRREVGNVSSWHNEVFL